MITFTIFHLFFLENVFVIRLFLLKLLSFFEEYEFSSFCFRFFDCDKFKSDICTVSTV